jgi:predicted porin
MKKHLIAAAVAAAVAAPAAFAQSSVTIYGGIDTGIQMYDPKSGSSVTSSAEGRIYSSRLGFRGTEDLGGGLTASFILESRLGGTTGSLGGASGLTPALPGDAGVVFGRETSVSLSGGFGTVSVGRLDLSAAEGVDTFTSQIGNLGFSTNAFELAADAPNSFRYTAPTFSGLTLQVGYNPNAGANAAVDPVDGELTSVSATYVAGKLGLAAGYTSRDGAAGDTDVMTLGARYDFGVARVGLFYGDHDVANSPADVKLTIVSASVPLGNGLSLIGSYRHSKVDTSSNKTTDVNVGVSKALSKRTTLYGIYADTDIKGTGASAFLLGAPTEDAKRYMFNVVHTF